MPRTLRERLALGAVLVTAVCLAAATFGFNLLLSGQLRSGATDLARTRAVATAVTVEVHPDGTLTRRGPQVDRSVESTTWIFQGTTALQRGVGDERDQEQAAELAGKGELVVDAHEPEAVRFLALPLLARGRQVGTVVSSVGLDPYDRVGRLALLGSLGFGLLVLGGAYLLTRTLVRRALAPVASMTQQAARWSASDVERRFGPAPRPQELQALAATLDTVLDRLAAGLRHEQQLSGQLSHELRTPLSAIVAEVELLDSRPRSAAELAAGHAAVLAAADRMSRVLESLLAAARATTGTAHGHCDVGTAVRDALELLQPPMGTVRVVGPVNPVSAGVDAALLERALAPVLDNAIRYCRNAVVVTINAADDGPRVTVEDDGPGMDPALAQSAFEPGVGTSAGAGLGLALARRLARAGAGDLRLEPSDAGARFVLSLPPS